MKRSLFPSLLLITVATLCIAWGSAGHFKISYNVTLFLNSQMSQFVDWPQVLADHASDADDRKQTDPNESPKHYIDIDNYAEFVTHGRIPQTIDSVNAMHGYYFVKNNGTLPWATKVTYDSLKACFQRFDWSRAVAFASDLGHYVADGHMPLHISKDYDGRTSSQSGIHSRYESTMISNHTSDIVYSGDSISVIPDVNQYIFNYLYNNFNYIDSVLDADDYAQTISTDTHSSQYKDALWNRTKGFTITLFKNASHALTQLIYTAWVQAGRPLMTETSINSYMPQPEVFLEQNYPNPFNSSTTVTFSIMSGADIVVEVLDNIGRRVDIIASRHFDKGNHSLKYQPSGLTAGNYYLVIRSGKALTARKMLLIP